MKYLIILLVFFLGACTSIQSNIKSWSKTDTAYQLTVVGLIAVDGFQTHSIAKNDWYENGHYHSEINPLFFNSKPHQDAVDILIPLAALIHTGVAFVLPPTAEVFNHKINPRRLWQLGFIFTETGAVGNNFIHSTK
jgi:hypothetical protein